MSSGKMLQKRNFMHMQTLKNFKGTLGYKCSGTDGAPLQFYL